MRGLTAMSAPWCAGPAMSRGLLLPVLDWPARLLRTVLREPRKQHLKRLLSNLIVDFSSPFLYCERLRGHAPGGCGSYG